MDTIERYNILTPGQIRLLSGGSLGVAAVGGAVRNSSGHWRVECRQVEVLSTGDCCMCIIVAGAELLPPGDGAWVQGVA